MVCKWDTSFSDSMIFLLSVLFTLEEKKHKESIIHTPSLTIVSQPSVEARDLKS